MPLLTEIAYNNYIFSYGKVSYVFQKTRFTNDYYCSLVLLAYR